jgi:acetyl-CoA acetyltransferase
MGVKAVDVLAAGQYIFPGSVPMYLYAPKTYSLAPEEVGQELFAKAGVSASDIDCAQIYDATSMMVPIALEDFGFVERGGAHDFLTSGGNGPNGALPVNTHGGLLSEGYFHGLTVIAEAVRQLRGESPNQLAKAETAFVTLRGASSMVLGRA